MHFKERAIKAIAQGTGTYSKRWDQYVDGVYDTHAIRGKDGVISFQSGDKIDFVCGLGSNILPGEMNNFSTPLTLEVEVAELIKETIPCINKLKFLKSGSDACQAAVRIARAYTGKHIIMGIGYHGWHNVFIAAEKPGVGTESEGYIKYETLDELIKWIDIEYFLDKPESFCDKIAAVIVEPVMLDINVKDKLLLLREKCTKYGMVLIFDEVVTGWRVPNFCIANYFNIQPDLICLGKAMANGHPISVIGGKQEIMDTPDYFISTTFSGEKTSLEKAKETIQHITREKLLELWNRGLWFQKEFNELSPNIQLFGLPTRSVWKGDAVYKTKFWQEMWKRGYFLGKAFFLSFNHSQEVLTRFLSVSKEVLRNIDENRIDLEGSLPKEVFKRT